MGWRAQHCKSPSASRCCASCVLISLSMYPGMNVGCKANHFCQHTEWGGVGLCGVRNEGRKEGRNEGRNGVGGRACVGGVGWSHQK